MYGAGEILAQLRAGVPWEIVEDDGTAVGFLSFSLEPDGRAKLHKMYLLPGHQHRGIGQRLLAHVCKRASALGASEVWLQVNKRNARAVGAYLKAGFRIEKEAVFDIGHGFAMDDYVMARSVG
jgi:ribosomal protein S18 acetylase RimI-like enzyme